MMLIMREGLFMLVCVGLFMVVLYVRMLKNAEEYPRMLRIFSNPSETCLSRHCFEYWRFIVG